MSNAATADGSLRFRAIVLASNVVLVAVVVFVIQMLSITSIDDKKADHLLLIMKEIKEVQIISSAWGKIRDPYGLDYADFRESLSRNIDRIRRLGGVYPPHSDLTGFFCARLNVVFFNLEEGVYEWRTRSMDRSRRS